MVQLSGWRTAWILGVFGAVFVAISLAVGADGPADEEAGATAMLLFVVIASIPAVVVVHEAGHALAATAVGYRVTSIRIRPFEDGYVSWERPEGTESTTRDTIAGLGGSALALAATVGLVGLDLHGDLAGWRAGLMTFSVLWHVDVLAPLPRPGFDIQRDGYVLARMWAEDRARRGRFDPGEQAQLDAIDAALHAGGADGARSQCLRLLHVIGDDTAYMRGAVLARLALADLLHGDPLRVHGEANLASIEALGLAPSDPVVRGVRGALLARIAPGHEDPATGEPRAATLAERQLLALVPGRRPATGA